MSDHLNYDEIIRIVKKDLQSLQTGRYTHYKNCKICQKEYSDQLSTDKVLQGIHPKQAPENIFKGVINRLSQGNTIKIKEKTDWIFLIAILLLFSIGSWFVFSGKAGLYIEQYTPDVVSENENIKGLEIIESFKDWIPEINFNIDLPHINFGNMYLALGIVAILFYMLIDRKISHNFKVRKT